MYSVFIKRIAKKWNRHYRFCTSTAKAKILGT